MKRRDFLLGLAGATLATGALSPAARAQQKFPTRPIRFVVPFAAGGGGDVVARILAARLSERFGTPIVVENRTGAGGSIGADYVLKSPPDGYTLLNMSSTYPIQAAVSKLPFDPVNDVQPIVMVSRDPAGIAVRPGSPIQSLKDLLVAAQKDPGKLTYGSAGVGSIAHLGVEELAYHMGIRLSHVPYKGTSQAFNDLIGNTLDLMLTSTTFAATYVRSGRMRVLAVAGNQRSARMPDVPTFAELGYPGYQVFDWKAVAGPKGIPPDIVATLNAGLNAVLKEKAVAERFETEGSAVIGGSPEEMLATIKADIERWKSIVEKAKVKIE